MNRELAVAVSRAPTVKVDGVFERHVSPSWVDRALVEGSWSGGRWAREGSFPVIYLGRPTDSVTIEAYRHLVDDVESMTEDRVRARYLLRAQVDVPDIVDLRDASVRLSLGLNDEDLISDIGDYEKCQNVGHAAHQLNRHGILTPAATGFGETLALFVDRLTVAELPLRLGEPMLWSKLPPDPRKLRLLENEEGTSIA